MALVNRGTPVITSRQDTTALSPNPTNDGWNYIAASDTGALSDPVEWPIIKNLTTAPVEKTPIDTTPVHHYPNTLFQYYNQLRAQNGRIFFPLFANYFAYYDPTTEAVAEFGPFIEDPPIVPEVSTIPYSMQFDVAGMLYGATQESQDRPSCLFSLDPDSLALTVIGYFGDSAVDYTTYGYYTAPDTGTTTKGIWNVYGESRWQLWFTTLAGVSTKLYDVPSTGFISFLNIPNKGWVAQIHTNTGKPDDVYTQWWCLADADNPNGALYPYTIGEDPPAGLARDVTPLTNPLVDPPEIDISGGIGVVGWRTGSSGPFAYVDYHVDHGAPVNIELAVTAPDGVLLSTEGYLGFVRYNASSHTGEWFGAQSGATIAQPIALYNAIEGAIWLSGYPNGLLLNYDPAAAWQTYPAQVNPANPGYYGAQGLNAAIKYAGNPITPTTIGAIGSLGWMPSAGATGRLYCVGTRERTGSGSGIGYWDKGTTNLPGTDAAPLPDVQPQGLVALDSLLRVAISTNTLDGSGPAPLYVYDKDLALVATYHPLATIDASISNLGRLFPTSDDNIVCGAYINAGSRLALYRWNITTGTLVQNANTSFTGPINAATIRIADGSIWLSLGDTGAGSIVRVNPDTLGTVLEQDTTADGVMSCLAFYQDELYLSSGPTLFSGAFPLADFSIDLGSGAFEIAGATIDITHVVPSGGGWREVVEPPTWKPAVPPTIFFPQPGNPGNRGY